MYDMMIKHSAKSYQPEKNELINPKKKCRTFGAVAYLHMKKGNSSPRNSTNLGHNDNDRACKSANSSAG